MCNEPKKNKRLKNVLERWIRLDTVTDTNHFKIQPLLGRALASLTVCDLI